MSLSDHLWRVGRLVPEDVIGLMKYMREHKAEEQAA
jgi:hypothetical protein